jgi:hypothetical protein
LGVAVLSAIERRSVIEHVEPGESLRLATAHEVYCREGYAEGVIREMCQQLAACIKNERARLKIASC